MNDTMRDNFQVLWDWWDKLCNGHGELVIIMTLVLIITFVLVMLYIYLQFLTLGAKEHKGHTLSYKGVVLTYTLHHENPETKLGILLWRHSLYPDLDTKLQQIIDNNPDTDFTKLETSLGIKILDIQRKAKAGATGIIIGTRHPG